MTDRPPELAATSAVYDALVGMPAPSANSLEAAGFARGTIERELSRLVGLGMVTRHSGGELEVVPPDLALPEYAARLEEEAARCRTLVDELAARYRQARVPEEQEGAQGVMVLNDTASLTRARRQVLESARESVVVVAARSPYTDRLLLDPRAVPAPAPGTTARPGWRAVFDTSVLELDGAVDAIDARRRDGATIRLHPALALSVLLVDGKVALVDITTVDSAGHGSLLVRNPHFVRALAHLCEATFSSAMLPPAAHAGTRESVGRRDARTLALLAVGATDSTIARQLGVSQRTVERYIRRIMDDLGATTRFQAGVQAARRGLL